jgi:hypothetical protein
MPLKLEQVRLTPFDAVETIPTGFKIAGEFKTRRAPLPFNYNWYARHDSVQHELFMLLAQALTTKPEGYTVDELKALFPNEADKAKVDEIINKFKGSWDHRHTGFDLLTDVATGTRFMLIWRDPRVHYAKEIGLEGDFSGTQFVKAPTYVENVPKLMEEARNPKPVVEKAPKAPKAAAAPKAPKAPKDAPAATTAPAGGYKAAFMLVAATYPSIEGATIGAILEAGIAKLVDPNATLLAPDDVTIKVIDRLNSVIDQFGLESHQFVDFVAKYQKETSIKAGFYKICKDLAKLYVAHVKAAVPAAAPAAPGPVAVPDAPATQPVA